MKKKILIMSFATLLGSAQYSFAKDSNSVKLRWFEAEGSTIYQVSGCVPGSDVSFYSQQGGGEMMKETVVNAAGSASVIWTQKDAPAFVLNVLNTNASGVAGNGMVTFTGDKEFTMNDVAIDNIGSNITLRWNASVSQPEFYTFEVLKSVNGTEWAVVQSVNAQSSGMLPYSFTEPSQSSAAATYQVRVKNNAAKEISYTSNPLYADGSNGISVYPTLTRSTVNVKLNDTRKSEYRILNMHGQVVGSGTLSNNLNTCSVSNLAAGTYLIEVSTLDNKATTMFVKE